MNIKKGGLAGITLLTVSKRQVSISLINYLRRMHTRLSMIRLLDLGRISLELMKIIWSILRETNFDTTEEINKKT